MPNVPLTLTVTGPLTVSAPLPLMAGLAVLETPEKLMVPPPSVTVEAARLPPPLMAPLEHFSGCCLVAAVLEESVAVLWCHRQECISDGINQYFERAGTRLT